VEFEVESGLGEEAVDERGPVLDALQPVPDDPGELMASPKIPKCARWSSPPGWPLE